MDEARQAPPFAPGRQRSGRERIARLVACLVLPAALGCTHWMAGHSHWQPPSSEGEKPPQTQRYETLLAALERLNRQAAGGEGYRPQEHRRVLVELKQLAAQDATPLEREPKLPVLIWGEGPQQPGATDSPDPQVVVAALEFWEQLGRRLPARAASLVEHPSGPVRLALLRAARNSPGVLWQICQPLLESGELPLRLQAVRSLGHLAGTAREQQALERLKRILQQEGELVRAAAVEALAAWKQASLLALAERDSSWRVRRQVARSLSRLPPAEAQPLARRLLEDESPLVQQAVVQAAAAWPERWCVPLWFQALESSVYGTRARAKELLARRVPQAAPFPLTAPLSQRREHARRLLQQWASERNIPAAGAVSSDVPRPEASPQAIPETVSRRLAELLQQARQAGRAPEQKGTWRRAMLEHRDVLPQWLEEQLLQGTDIDPVLDEQMLYALGGPYRLLGRWADASPGERRALAAQLRKLATQRRLGPLVHYVLAARLRGEQDPVVWRNVLRAIQAEESNWAIQIARLGVSHPDPEVRRRACVYLGEHPRPEHYAWLVERVDDAHTPVVLAAVEALGRSGHPEALQVLKRMLLAPESQVQVAAAEALAQLQPETGRRALERLCWHRQWEVRRRAAVALGHLGHRESVPVLLHLLDDVPEVRQAALAALPRCSGLEPPPSLRKKPPSELAAWWKQQFGSRQAHLTSKQPER